MSLLGKIFGLSAGNTVLGSLMGLANQAIGNSFERKLAEQQNQFNLDMWNKQNEYNLPSNQVKRLVDAGLSPALAYGSVSTGNSQAAPQLNAARQSFNIGENTLLQNVNNLSSAYSMLESMSQMKERTKYMRLQNENLRARLDGLAYLTDGDLATYYFHDRGYDWQRKLELNTRIAQQNDFYGKSLDYRLKGLGLQNDLLRARFNLANKQGRLFDTQLRLRRLDEDFYRADKYFNYITGGLRTIGSFIPKFK